ncbi:hypothetical protein SCHPADRAFT_371784 [Schizopora paradoxa]|uniref:L domain-like protein n=1 Tax=Schizopora paradoxa TaxID=27342 RepID=A0A0H2RNR0_9AGAM|nr:hypothetical protein SCHPADRAFT_371784 [Schizopora paradoxa]
MVLQPAFSEESNFSFSSVSRSSSSSGMSSPYTVDSSPPSSPIPDERMDEDDGDVQTTPGSSKGWRGKPNKTVSWRAESSRDVREREAENDTQHSPVHPFSASTLSTMTGVMHKSPTLYEKDGKRARYKRHNPKLSITEDDVKAFISRSQLKAFEYETKSRNEDAYLTDDLTSVSRGKGRSMESPVDVEDRIWEEAIDGIVDFAGHTIDLSNRGLETISTKIADIGNLVVLQSGASASNRGSMSRANSTMSRTMSRSTTSSVFGADTLGAQAREIHIYLPNNLITTLPHELFRLNMLVTLSLRANQLAEIPPLISGLRNLREFNVANNKLRYLPSEIMDLKLTSLSVEMNPFFKLEDPEHSSKFDTIARQHDIMPLTEHALRVLFQPISNTAFFDPTRSKSETTLEAFYETPLDAAMIPPNVKAVLSACAPGLIPTPQSTSNTAYSPSAHVHSHPPAPSSFVCISTCPSAKHRTVDSMSHHSYRVPVFVDHAEEIYTLEKEIAGCKVGGETGVPVRWRGCSAGCLNGMLGETGDAVPNDNENNGDWDMDVDLNAPVVQHAEDSDGENLPEVIHGAVQPAVFSSEGFDFDD